MSSEELSLDEIRQWRVDALKEFCRKRNLKTSGRKDELVARVFAASEMKVPICATAVELALQTENEKAKLLQVSNICLPDPLKIKEGWIGEADGIKSWPPIFLSDITIFLMADHPGKDVTFNKRVLTEYKEGKAHRLFQSGWLKEVFIHSISDESVYCFLRANCTHTMKISDLPHTAWICVEKKSGKVVSAYCTCLAG